MESTFQFPSVAESDPSDVAVAIETANALWRRGEPQESLRWLRRAADSAEAEGDDMRALSLARAAADMQEVLRPSVPPPASQGAAPRRSTPAPFQAPPPSRPSAAATPPPLPSSPAAAPRSVAPPSRSAATATATPAPRSSAPPSRPAATATATPAPGGPPALPAEALATRPGGSAVPPAPKLEPWRPKGEPSTPVAPAVDTVTGLVAMDSPAAPAAVRAAVRVSVETFSKANRTYIVRVLGEGEAPPAGASEALLVPTSREVDFTRGS